MPAMRADAAAGDPTAALQAIWATRRDEVLARVETIERAVAALLGGDLRDELRTAAAGAAHKLAGSAGTFGFHRASDLARELEVALGGPEPPAPAEAPRLSTLVVALRGELEAEQPGAPPAAGARGQSLLVIGRDSALTERLLVEAMRRDMRAQSVAGPSAARAVLLSERPTAVVLDLSLAGDTAEGLSLLSDMTRQDVPVVTLTATEALADRVDIARCGGRAVLQKHRPPSQVLDAVEHVLERPEASAGSLLAVDDDPLVLDVLREVLEPEHFTITGISDPQLFTDALAEHSPDLVLLDIEMPGVSGLELCRVLRADPRHAQIPVLFLTALGDRHSVQAIFEAGADDYVAKPIIAAELRARIRNRLERVRLYRQFAERDPLTGVYNRRGASAALDRLIRMADRFEQPLSVAVLDLDRFKSVNDRFGHTAGDDVLRGLGRLLLDSFRGEDVVARWGGEEFLVGMYGMSKSDSVQRIAEALERFRGETFAGGEARGLTFTGGVAEYPADGRDVPALCDTADIALRDAKAAGRNRLVPAGWRGPLAGEQPDVLVVEDDEAIVDVLLQSLETRGHTVRCIGDGEEAARALADSAVRPRVVLLDVDLPGLDGLSVLRALAANGVVERARVIMLTARSSESEVLEALELGAFDHVGKPFSVPILLQRIRRALRSER